MGNEEIVAKLSQYVFEGDPELVAEWTDKAIAAGLEPLAIINDGLTKGIEMVGEHFAAGDADLPHDSGGQGHGCGNQKTGTAAGRDKSREFIGRVLIGTVAGDLTK